MSEKLHSDSGPDPLWDSLINVEFAGANSANTTPVNETNEMNSEKADRVREELLSTAEDFARNERKSYNYLAEELTKSSIIFPQNNNPVEDYGALSSKIDSSRFAEIIGYIDAISAQEPDSADVANSCRDEYFRATKARGEALFDAASYIQKHIAYTGNENLDGAAQVLGKIKQTLPEEQLRLANAYFDYFDDPSEQAKRSLDNHVGNYVASFQTSLGSLFSTLPSASANSEALLDSEYKLRQHLSLGYEDIHKLIMDYYKQKTSARGAQIELPPSQTSPAKPSSDELPIDDII
ncbi:hypothetical protein IKF86_01380 [Candidatus Saccharibacteria bacterium]|nr:hypothetical protein [Candidatus Saccharibacteria bacterium]